MAPRAIVIVWCRGVNKEREDRHSGLGSESNQLAFCGAVMAQVRDLFYLAEPKSLTIPKGTGLTDHQTDAALTALVLHNHSILIPTVEPLC